MSQQPIAKRINIMSLKGKAKADMWALIQREHPELAEDLQSGGCALLREQMGIASIIVALDAEGHIVQKQAEPVEAYETPTRTIKKGWGLNHGKH